MHISDEQKLLAIIERETIPAVGCTEPVAVALAVAQAAVYSEGTLLRIDVEADANIFKNGLRVGIPGCNGVGLLLAAALGYVKKNPEKKLEVLAGLTIRDIEDARSLVERGLIAVGITTKAVNGLYVGVTITSKMNTVRCIVADRHTNIKYIEVDGIPIYDKNSEIVVTKETHTIGDFNLSDLYSFSSLVPVIELDHLYDGLQMNLLIALEGFRLMERTNLEMAVDHTEDEIIRRAKNLVSSAVYARMSGVTMSVMTTAGSGNQGLVATLPLLAMMEANKCSKEKVLRAMALSNLVTSYIKYHTGLLGPICSCGIAAGAGASAGAVLLMGGGLEEIHASINIVLTTLFGMICDGAKKSCAFKAASAAGTAVEAAHMAMNGVRVDHMDGVISRDADQSIRDAGKLCNEGFINVNDSILGIITSHSL